MLTMAFDFSSYLIILIVTIFMILMWKAATLLLFSQSSIPGPKGNWLLGQMFELRQSKDVLQTFCEWGRTYGPVVEFRPLGIFDRRYYLISDADALKQILISRSVKYHKPPLNEFNGFKLLTEKNIFVVNGKDHARIRKMLNPSFKVNNLKSMIGVFQGKTKLLANYWSNIMSTKSKSSGNRKCRLVVQDDFTRLALDVLGECVFGYSFNAIEKGQSMVTSAFIDILSGANLGVKTLKAKIERWFPFTKLLTESSRKHEEGIEVISGVIKQLIKDKRENQAGIPVSPKDLLDLLLDVVDDESGQSMDEEELFTQVCAFLLAGHETSAATLSWIFYFLAQYPNVQEKLRQEVKMTLKEQEENWETYDSMEYLTAVINETLRLSTPAAVYRRKVFKDDDILGYTVPADSMIIISPYVLHRKHEYWSDPETFNPARFLEPNKASNPGNRYAFMPFSSGPRTCIGYRFALMEIKIVVSTLIQRFSFSMIPGMSFEGSMSITYKPKPNLELLVQPLNESKIL